MMLAKALASASASAAKIYVEEVFQTWLYTGNGSTQTITNGIDLAGEGGMVWMKIRSSADSHYLADSTRKTGTYYDELASNQSYSSQTSRAWGLTSLNSDGFSLGGNNLQCNNTGSTYATWTFRKAEKFFDVVTYTGDGTANRNIAHSLGSVPGCIIVKRTSTANSWAVYHRSLSNGVDLILDSNSQAGSFNLFGSKASQTSTTFQTGTLGNIDFVNASGSTYVAYLFAHDAGGFGDSETESVIKCGSYVGNGTSQIINLGWEPQWVLIKRTDSTGEWGMRDTMRGMAGPSSGDQNVLYSNLSNAEVADGRVYASSTGFGFSSEGSANVNASGSTYIYIAIRRGPMKTPTDATKVFNAVFQDGTAPNYEPGFVTDAAFRCYRPGGGGPHLAARLTGPTWIATSSTAAEAAQTNATWDYMTGWYKNASASTDVVTHNFRRAHGFFDVVAYTGTGSATTVSHNLGVAPELMIVKSRNSTGNWIIYNSSIGTSNALLFTNSATVSGDWNATAPTSSVFSIGSGSAINGSGNTYITYIFATCPGVSKVGSYTGTGTTLSVDCGFTSGARFVLIKRTDSTGDWYVWDTARGIVSGNDPYLLINSTAAEVTSTDYIDPLSSGFQISSTAPAAINANGGSFIFLAIA